MRGKEKSWSDKETKKLIRLCRTEHSMSAIKKKFPDRTMSSISGKRRNLKYNGVDIPDFMGGSTKDDPNTWSDEDTKELLRLAKQMKSNDYIAEKLSRTVPSITKKKGKLRKAGFDVPKLGSGGSFNDRLPKILIYDLETLPMEFKGRAFTLKTEYINPKFVTKQVSLACWKAKWWGDDKMYGDCVSWQQAYNRKDKGISKSLFNMINEADIVVGHNAKNFDNKIANTRFVMNELGKPNDYKTIDTLTISKQNFRFESNKLDYLSQIMFNKEKIYTNMKLWDDCCSGNKEVASKALDYMFKYNDLDVLLTEEVLWKFAPWIKGINSALYYDGVTTRCCNPLCGSENIVDITKRYYTTTGRYKIKKCLVCGSTNRNRVSDLTKEERKSLVVPLPR